MKLEIGKLDACEKIFLYLTNHSMYTTCHSPIAIFTLSISVLTPLGSKEDWIVRVKLLAYLKSSVKMIKTALVFPAGNVTFCGPCL